MEGEIEVFVEVGITALNYRSLKIVNTHKHENDEI
jgi:hypothetical protein